MVVKHSPIDQEALTEKSGEGFLSRWSRRKALVQSHTRAQADNSETPEHQATSPADNTGNPVHEHSDADQVLDARNQLTDADMPALDLLDENSDYSPFLSENVSVTLRRRALRQMFRLPKFSLPDGLNDYDEDYTWFEPLGM